jgi:hypothetical protein
MSYEKCKEKFLALILGEYERGKLKMVNDKRVKKRNHAIAIALSMAQRNCKYTRKDLREVEEKVIIFLKKDKRKISEKRIPLTNVIETRVLIKNYIKIGKNKKAKQLYKLLILRVVNADKNGINISKNIYKEVKFIKKMLNM